MVIERFTQPVVDALKALGVDATGRNDIMGNDKKISGNAQLVHNNRLLHHGTLLYNLDMDTAAQALKVSADKFHSKAAKSVHSRIENLIELLDNRQISILDFRDYLLERLIGGHAEECELIEPEKEDLTQLHDKKYRSWEWTYGESPKFDCSQKRKYLGLLFYWRFSFKTRLG